MKSLPCLALLAFLGACQQPGGYDRITGPIDHSIINITTVAGPSTLTPTTTVTIPTGAGGGLGGLARFPQDTAGEITPYTVCGRCLITDGAEK